MKEVEYLVPGIPLGMITTVSGRPGYGKSTWSAQLAAAVSQDAPVIFSNQEDPVEQIVVPRLEAAGAVLRRVFLPEEPYRLPNDVHALERRVASTGARLIVLDPANVHLATSASSGQAVRQALSPLKAMLERTNCACVWIDHLIKRPRSAGHPLEALSGAGSGLPAASRFVYVFGRNPKDGAERVLAPVKVNAAEMPASVLYEMDGAAVFTHDGKEIEVGRLTLVSDDSDIDASQVIAFKDSGKAAEDAHGVKGAIAAEYLTGLLMFGPKPAKDVENEGKAAGFSWRTLQRAGEKIGMIRKREGFGKGSVVIWRLPDGHPALKVGEMLKQNGATP
jgi:hypothetical protein